MGTHYSQEELDKAYEKLPEELQEAIFSMETSQALWNIGERHDVMDKRYGEIARYVSYVLLGLTLPSELQDILEKEVKIPKAVAKEIARDINRFVFYPVRPALEQLHRMEIEVSAKIVTPQPAEEGETPIEKTKQKPRGPDTYREPIE